jgi:hypothetical protein
LQGLRAFGDRELQAAVPRLMLAIPSSAAAVESFVPAGSVAERNRVRACISWCARTYARAACSSDRCTTGRATPHTLPTMRRRHARRIRDRFACSGHRLVVGDICRFWLRAAAARHALQRSLPAKRSCKDLHHSSQHGRAPTPVHFAPQRGQGGPHPRGDAGAVLCRTGARGAAGSADSEGCCRAAAVDRWAFY